MTTLLFDDAAQRVVGCGAAGADAGPMIRLHRTASETIGTAIMASDGVTGFSMAWKA